MLAFIVRRVVMLIPLLFVLSLVAFLIIQLPPGDWVSTHIANLRASGVELSADEAAALTRRYGLDQPAYQQYLNWIGGILLRGDFGYSFQWNRSVNTLLAERIPLTVAISLAALVFSWMIAIPIGIYSATHQYSWLDYVFTFIGFIGLATPGFLLALVLAYFVFVTFGFSPLGLFSNQYVDAPWSGGKLLDMLKRIWLPLVIIAMSGTAATIRVMRANLLDELGKQYVTTARAKGLSERKVLLKYPVRMAINPIISTIGWVLPAIISGEVLVSIVLGLQTTGPLLLRAVLAQDMYLAGSIVLILSSFAVVGTLISDILLGWLDPRIRYEGGSK